MSVHGRKRLKTLIDLAFLLYFFSFVRLFVRFIYCTRVRNVYGQSTCHKERMELCYLNKTDIGSFFTRLVNIKMSSSFGQRSVPLFHPWFSSNKAGDRIANGIISSGLKSGTEALDWYSSQFCTAFTLNQRS